MSPQRIARISNTCPQRQEIKNIFKLKIKEFYKWNGLQIRATVFYNQNELTTKIKNKINEIKKTMEALQSRILIEHVKGSTIAYL